MSETAASEGASFTASIERATNLGGRARVPGSKSVTNRALVCASLAGGKSEISGGLAGGDADSMVAGLRALGALVEERSHGATTTFTVGGTAGALSPGPVVIDAELAGTTYRFLTAVAALGPGRALVTGRPPLLRRPIGPFLSALRELGADVRGEVGRDAEELGPVTVNPRSGKLGGRASLDASRSSQFVSALLLAAPLFDEPLELEVEKLAAGGFVGLTSEVMGAFGAHVDQREGGYLVAAPAPYESAGYRVPPDASAAAHLLTLAMATGGAVVVEGLAAAATQPDFAVLALFEAFGGTRLTGEEGAVGISGPDRLSPVDADLSAMPDELPNLAVLAALARGRSRLSGVGVTRFHESDRMAVLAEELGKAGVFVSSGAGELVIDGGTARAGARFSSHGDHRVAMALTAFAGALGGCSIEGADAVSKTYALFFEDASRLGLVVRDELSGRLFRTSP